MRRSFAVIPLVLAASAAAEELGKPPYAADTPLVEPQIFADGAICTGDYESHPAFTPDGRTLYFVKSTPNFGFWTIFVSRWDNGKWSVPEVAPFSGQYADADPFITADGSKLYFISNRPVPGRSGTDLDIWVMEKAGAGWSEPKNVGAPINTDRNEWFPTVARNGTIYFGSEREGGKGRCDIYSARLEDGTYKTVENLGDAINTPAGEFEPCISPDDNRLIFAASGRKDGKGEFDVFVSERRDGAWSPARNAGDKLNTEKTEFSPTISPDGRYFFFTSTRGFADKPLPKRIAAPELIEKLRAPRNGLGDIYQIDLRELPAAQ